MFTNVFQDQIKTILKAKVFFFLNHSSNLRSTSLNVYIQHQWISPGVSILHHGNLITSYETASPAYFHNIPHLIPVKLRIKTKVITSPLSAAPRLQNQTYKKRLSFQICVELQNNNSGLAQALTFSRLNITVVQSLQKCCPSSSLDHLNKPSKEH